MNEVILYFIRHGETLLNKLGRVQGWCDSPLTDEGRKSAYSLRRSFESLNISAIYSSNLPRAYATAEIICQGSCPIHKDSRIREWCLDSLEGMPARELMNIIINNSKLKADELNTHLPQVCKAIKALDKTGMAEHFDDITTRLLSFLKDIGDKWLDNNGKIIVVTHAFVIKTLIHLLDYNRLKDIGAVGNSSVTIIGYDGNNFRVKDVINKFR